MENRGLISVIIPVYNVELYLRECIDSVLNQTYQNFEIILVDDGSTDSSGEICDEYKEKDSRIEYIYKENNGASSARNIGLKNAKGEYVYFLDSDDYLEQNAFEILTELIGLNCYDLVFFEAGCFNEYGVSNQGNYSYKVKYGCASGKEQLKRLILNNEFHVSVPLLFIRKRLLDESQIEFIEGIMYEDMVYTFELMYYSKSVIHCDKKLYNRRFRSSSVMTAIITKHNFNSAISVYNKLLEYMADEDLLFEKYTLNYISRWALNCINIYAKLDENKKVDCRADYKKLIDSVKKRSFFDNKSLKYRCYGIVPWFIYKCAAKVLHI